MALPLLTVSARYDVPAKKLRTPIQCLKVTLLTKKILFSLSLRNQSVLVTCCEDLCIQTVFPFVITGTVIGVEDRVCIRPASFGVREEEMVGISKDVRGGNTVPLP